MTMNNPKLYSIANGLVRYTVSTCLAENIGIIKWKEPGDTIIDLGCGDGSVTLILKQYLPQNYKKFVACDINENMLRFAREQHNAENITFRLQDVEGVLADDLKCSFSHVFSFFLLHWIRKQEETFQNIYDLMMDGGECFLLFFAYMPFYHVYDILSRTSKWGDTWLKGIADDYLSPYYGIKDPHKRVIQILESCGFVDIDVQCNRMRYAFENVIEMKQLLRAVEPHNMPVEVFEDFFNDFLTVGHDIDFIDRSINSVDDTHQEIILNYTMLVVHACKPYREK